MKSSNVLKIRLRLAGKTDDERRAQCDAGNARADFRDQIDDVLLRGFAAHPFQHVFVDVLQRHVHVARDFRAFGDGPDQFIRPMRRMGVKQSNPKIAGQAHSVRATSVQSVVASAGSALGGGS